MRRLDVVGMVCWSQKAKISETRINLSMLCSIGIYSATVASIMKQHPLWHVTLVSIVINSARRHNHNLKDDFCSAARWQMLLCRVILSECCGFAHRTIDAITNMVLKKKKKVTYGTQLNWFVRFWLHVTWFMSAIWALSGADGVICWKCQSNICIKKKKAFDWIRIDYTVEFIYMHADTRVFEL